MSCQQKILHPIYINDNMMERSNPKLYRVCYNLLKMMEIKYKNNFPTKLDARTWGPWMILARNYRHKNSPATRFYNEENNNHFIGVDIDLYEEYFRQLRKDLRFYNENIYSQNLQLFFSSNKIL